MKDEKSSLLAILELAARRDNAVPFEGYVIEDNNWEGNLIIAVSGESFFSFPKQDLEIEELGGGRMRVWVRRGARGIASSMLRAGHDVSIKAGDDLTLGQKVPNKSEAATVGAATTKIVRDSDAFKALDEYDEDDVVFKDEEQDGSDKMMTKRLKDAVKKLAGLVSTEWPNKKLRVVEAWDGNDEHSTNSTHYEARAVDITVSDVDDAKLGRLGRLAVNAGFEWVFYEDEKHVHASMKK